MNLYVRMCICVWTMNCVHHKVWSGLLCDLEGAWAVKWPECWWCQPLHSWNMNNWRSSRLSAPTPSRGGIQSESHPFSRMLRLSLSLSLFLSFTLPLYQLVHSPLIYVHQLWVCITEILWTGGLEITWQEPCLDTSWCSNQSDDPRLPEGMEKGTDECRLKKDGSLSSLSWQTMRER